MTDTATTQNQTATDFITMIQQGGDPARNILATGITLWNTLHPDQPIAGVAASPGASSATPSTTKPSVTWSILAFVAATVAQLTGAMGAPLSIPGIIDPSHVTQTGLLSSALPLLSAIVGKSGGWSAIGSLLTTLAKGAVAAVPANPAGAPTK